MPVLSPAQPHLIVELNPELKVSHISSVQHEFLLFHSFMFNCLCGKPLSLNL